MSESPSRANALSNALSKARRTRNRNTADTNSTVSNGSDGNISLPGNQEGIIDMSKQNHGADEGDNEESSRLSKLLPKGLNPKRRIKKLELEEQQRASEEAARGRAIAERGTLENGDGTVSTAVDGDGSSFITYESETESRSTPLSLSTHPSHIGYLTTSFPLVRASTLSDAANSELQLDGASKSAVSPQTNTLAILEPLLALNTSTLQAPNKESPKRPTSPAGRLRDAFNPRRGPSPSTSPNRKPEAGGGFGSPLARNSSVEGIKKRGSVASRIESIFPDKQTSQVAASSESLSDSGSGKPSQLLDTSVRPQTPTVGDNAAPIIVNTPPTPTDIGARNFSEVRERGSSDPVTITNPNVVTSASGNMISHRRIRSGPSTVGPSRLLSITSAPLAPTPENGPASTSNTNTSQQGGFFSTVFSAAQNAANTLSNSIANTSLAPGQNKSRSVVPDLKEIDNVEVEPAVEETLPGQLIEQKEPAVKTLGMGDLSLSHLGISEPSNTPTIQQFSEVQERGRSESANRDDLGTNKTVTSVLGENFESGSVTQVDDSQSLARIRSFYEPSTGEQTPPNDNIFDTKSGIPRNGSIQSAVNRRRKRGSSAATGTTIGTAIVAGTASAAHLSAQGSTPKLTGFAVASKKRNRDFHQLFRSVPEDDFLIEDYSCALQREILAHGRLYVSEGHLCFSSNIFGWVTTLVMSFDEIISVEKRSTALVFKNGLMISTLHAKNIFASFTSRDSTYDLIVGIWKLGHPNLRSSLNGVSIEETGGGDKTEKCDAIGSQSGSGSEEDSDEGDEVYDEDDIEEDGMSYTQGGEGSVAGSDVADKPVSRKPSAMAAPSNGGPVEKSKESSPGASSNDFPGPATHAPTDCTDKESHYDKILSDDIIPTPLGKVYSVLFGPASPSWMSKWLTNEQKCLDLQMEDKKGLSNDNKVRVFSYIKPLNSSIGPKQTKCIITETIDSIDLEKAVSVTVSTQTPDVPSGNVFSTKTKYCLSWAEGNSTRLQMNCTIEWTGKSWLKGPIEKGANDGQKDYAKDLCASLKVAASGRRGPVATPGKSKKKGRKEKSSQSSPGKLDGASDSKTSTVEDWGLLEPLRSPLEPVIDVIKPLLSGNMGYGLLVGLLVAAWFGFGYSNSRASSKDIGYFGTPERIAAYEEIWRREESELWDWLEERVGMEWINNIPGKTRGCVDEVKSIEEKLRDEKATQREMEAAIKVTEEKLKTLKGVLEKQKRARNPEKKMM